jgi:Putative phage tail protein
VSDINRPFDTPNINRPFDTPNINRPLGSDPYTKPVPTPAPTLPAPQPAPPALPPAPTPIDPQQLAATLYDKFIPAVVSDLVQVGGRIIEGPDYTVINNESVVSFAAAYFIPMNWWQATRTVTKLWFRGKEAWNTTAGALMSDLHVGVATSSNQQTVRFNTGTLTQPADAWSVAKYGSGAAIAYIPCVTATFENIRLAQFDGFTPFTSVTVQDTAFGTPGDGVPWASALATLARYAGRDLSEFETVDVSGAVGAIILGSAMTDMEVFAGLRKLRPNWTLRTGRKLYIVEKGPLDLDLTIDRDNVLANDDQPITFGGIDAFDKPKTLKCNYINSVRDYEPDYVTAGEDSFPVPSTDAFDEDDFNLPIASTPSEMVSQLSYAYYTGEMARETAEYTGMAPYYGIEVGDTQLIAGDRDYYQRVVEVTRKPDFTIDVKTEGFLTCAIAGSGPPPVVLATLDGTPANVTLSSDLLTATHNSSATNSGARSTAAKGYSTPGQFYFEVTMVATHGDHDGVGLSVPSAGYATVITGNSAHIVFAGGGIIYMNGVNTGKAVGTIVAGDVISVATSFTSTSGTTWFRRNNGSWNGDPSANPVTGVGGNVTTGPASTAVPTLVFGGTGTAINDKMIANFGQSPYVYPVPSGYGNWSV